LKRPRVAWAAEEEEEKKGERVPVLCPMAKETQRVRAQKVAVEVVHHFRTTTTTSNWTMTTTKTKPGGYKELLL
jgi:hypothetical protein